jgi:MoxR-like ATPase
LIASAAILDGRITARANDLWTLIYAVPTHEQQSSARDSLHELLAETENKTLPYAAEDASLGALARATRLINIAAETLQNRPAESEDQEAWKLKIEGIAREIDAGFNAETMPQGLAETRAKVVGILGRGEETND